MSRNTGYEDQERENVYGQWQFPEEQPPPVFRNTYYDEPPIDMTIGEYAPLHGPQPEVIQNEVYKIPPRFNYQLVQDEDAAGSAAEKSKNEAFNYPLNAGISFAAILLLILICCIIPLVCLYCLNPKPFKKVTSKIGRVLKNPKRHDQISNEKAALLPPKKKRKRKCDDKTWVNVKINEAEVEVSVTEQSDGSSCDEEEDYKGGNQDKNQEGNFSESGFNDNGNHRSKRKVKSPPKRLRVEEPRQTRNDSESREYNERKVSTTPGPGRHSERKRHSLPVPTPSDFRPPPFPVHSYENKKLPELRPVYNFLNAPSDDNAPDPDPEEERSQPRSKRGSDETFYEDHMASWDSNGDR